MASMNEKDYYAILEVDEKATTDEIRKAFQKKARKLHPDVNKEPDAEERFKEVSEAYAVLSDDNKRKRYDAMRSGVPFGGGVYPGGSGGGYAGGSPFGEGFPFGGSWSGQKTMPRSYRPRVGADVVCDMELDAKDAKSGVRRGITYQRFVACDVCHGSGSVEHTQPITCPTCGGAGRMKVDLGGMGLFGIGYFEVTCPECEGAGKVVADPCSSCGGSGRVLAASEVVVEIPPDSHNGTEVRVEGKGNAGTNGMESGDLICRVGVAEERLSTAQTSGFRFIGFSIPFIVIGILQPVLIAMTVIGVVMAAMGIVMVVREGLRANGRWWAQAGTAVVAGASSGLIVGLLLMFSGPFLTFIIPIILFMLLFTIIGRRQQ